MAVPRLPATLSCYTVTRWARQSRVATRRCPGGRLLQPGRQKSGMALVNAGSTTTGTASSNCFNSQAIPIKNGSFVSAGGRFIIWFARQSGMALDNSGSTTNGTLLCSRLSRQAAASDVVLECAGIPQTRTVAASYITAPRVHLIQCTEALFIRGPHRPCLRNAGAFKPPHLIAAACLESRLHKRGAHSWWNRCLPAPSACLAKPDYNSDHPH